jgi:hypothetical protein
VELGGADPCARARGSGRAEGAGGGASGAGGGASAGAQVRGGRGGSVRPWEVTVGGRGVWE